MCRIQCIGNLNREVQKLVDLLGRRFRNRPYLNPAFQGLSLQKLHHNEGLPFEFADVVNRTDVGMIER